MAAFAPQIEPDHISVTGAYQTRMLAAIATKVAIRREVVVAMVAAKVAAKAKVSDLNGD